MFLVTDLKHISYYRQMKDVFGILPMPKASTEQEKYISVGDVKESTMLMIPASRQNDEDLGIVVQALAELSEEILTPVYYSMILKYRDFVDTESVECLDIIFDSNIDNWSANTSVFDDKIKGKKQLVFLIEDEDNEIFGYYLNTQIVEKYNKWIETDYKSFEFNLQSKNNRLNKSMKFEIIDLYHGGTYFFENIDKN